MLQDQTIDVGEVGMRLSARKIVMLIYPEASLKIKLEGAAVSILQYDGDGNVTEAKILESPDAAAGQSVLEAVKHWKFAGSKLQDKPINVYFVIDRNGKGQVKNPKQYQ